MKNSTIYKNIISVSVFLILFLASGNIMAQRVGLSSATVVASPATICEGSSSSLTLSVTTCLGNSGGQVWSTGATYQWESSPDNAAWTPIGGATTDTYNASPTSNTYYRCSITVNQNIGCGTPNGGTYTTVGTLVTVTPLPGTPGPITGSTSVAASTAGLLYNISAVANADSYVWTVPTGWTISSGQTTLSISATTTGSAESGNITVTPTNTCGTSGPAILAVSVVSDDCPVSNTITPSAVQTHCQGDVADELTALITTSGGTGPVTLLYEWWYNTVDSNDPLHASAVQIGVTSNTYTPSTATAETRYYFCVGYATDNNCGQSNDDILLASTSTVQVNVNASPAAVVVSGGGTFCVSTTITADNGGEGTIYWQGTTSGGTSTLNPSSSELVTTSGTYYFRAMNAGCWGAEGSTTVTINPLPTPTASNNGPVCIGDALSLSAGGGTSYSWSGPLSYSSPSQNPTVSSSATLAMAGSYTVTVTLNGCDNTASTTVEVNDVPAVPGTISGNATVDPNTSGYVYSVTAVPGATSYTWTIPAHPSWSSDESTTNTLTVTSGNLGQDGNITVTANNSCGSSAASSKFITVAAAPDCPTVTSITPSTVQTHCIGDGGNQLTANITTGGGAGTPTLQYQWYYNTTNSNTIVGSTAIGGNSLNYTPLTTAAEEGSRWYFCVGYAADNGCGQANTDQALASNTVEVTVNSAPVTPGAISGPESVNPSTTGLGYSITAVPTATSYTWTVPEPTGWSITAGGSTTTMTATSGLDGENGNITVTATNVCGTSSASSLPVTVTVASLPPTITLGENPSVCTGNDANLTYSATTDSPNQYSINYDDDANIAGLTDVTNAALPASPIILATSGIAAGEYSGTLTVKNSTSGLSSGNYGINVTIMSTPSQPSAITGVVAANENSAYIYSIPSVTYANSYNWTVPAGWTINSGQGTTSINITSGASGQNGNISVRAENSCGNSPYKDLPVTSVTAVDHSAYNCNSCHVFHTALGSALTNNASNALLCQACHTTGGNASANPIEAADKAIPGTSGSSHAWDVPAVNATYETALPTNNEMLIRLDGSNKIICSTCHDQHNNVGPPYLRTDNTNDAMCKDCHSARVVMRYQDGASNKGSHPIDIAYNDSDSRFVNTQTLITNGSNMLCSTCHGLHNATSGGTNDGNLLKMANDNNLCTDCHVPMTHNGFSCKDCHQTHNPNKTNIYMIASIVNGSAVNFTSETAFTKETGADDGICEVCHTSTSYHLANGTGEGHNVESNCTSCHPHSSNFAPEGGSCTDCHNSVQAADSRSGAPQIVGSGGEFDPTLTSRHTAADPVAADCEMCHQSAASHPSNLMTLEDIDIPGTVWSGDTDVYCVKCHDGNAPNLPQDYSYINTAIYNKSSFIGTPHDNTTNSCLQCHNRHGSANDDLLSQAGNYNLCNSCHNVTINTTGAVNAADIATPGGSGTSHAWDVSASSGLYETNTPTGTAPGPAMTVRLSGGNIVCSTCHQPHDNSNTNFLVADNSTDAMCKDCHSARDVQRYQDGSTNKGSHPVGVNYSGTGNVKATPTGSVITVGGNVECSSCHMTHNSTTTDGNLLRQTANNTMCIDCHSYSGNHNGFTCKDCHQTHNPDKTNIFMIANTVNGNTVNFTSETAFTKESGVDDGICEVCHTGTTYHLADGTGEGHETGTNCTGCHTHSTNFAAPSCHGCHDATPGAYQYPTTADGYNEGAHAVHCSPPYEFKCSTCHFNLNSSSPGHNNGTGDVIFDPNGLATRNGADGNTPGYDTGTKTCSNIYCHSDGISSQVPTGDVWDLGAAAHTASSVSNYATIPAWNAAAGSVSCGDCHSGTISGSSPPATGEHLKGAHMQVCGWCHSTDGTASTTGTYPTNNHIDGIIHFDAKRYANGGTMSTSTADAWEDAHCGDKKSCWW